MAEEERMLTATEAVAELKISRATLYNWIKAGKLTPVPQRSDRRLPRVRFRQSEVDALKLPEQPAP